MASENDPRPLSVDMSDRLKQLGFEAGWPIIVLSGSAQDESLGVSDFTESLRTSTYWAPCPVKLIYSFRDDCGDNGWVFAIVPELVQAVYVPYTPRLEQHPIGCWEHPDWYIRGRLAHGGFNPDPHPDRVHIWMESSNQEGALPEEFFVQLVRGDRTDTDPDACLTFLPQGAIPGQF